MRLYVAVTLFLSIVYSENSSAQQNCETHELDANNESVAVADATFMIKNKGSNPVNIVYNDAKNRVMTIEGGRGSFFAGNESFDYYIMLANQGETTTIEICN